VLVGSRDRRRRIGRSISRLRPVTVNLLLRLDVQNLHAYFDLTVCVGGISRSQLKDRSIASAGGRSRPAVANLFFRLGVQILHAYFLSDDRCWRDLAIVVLTVQFVVGSLFSVNLLHNSQKIRVIVF
jgi:hypothetical protein